MSQIAKEQADFKRWLETIGFAVPDHSALYESSDLMPMDEPDNEIHHLQSLERGPSRGISVFAMMLAGTALLLLAAILIAAAYLSGFDRYYYSK